MPFSCVTAGAWEANPAPQTAQLLGTSTVAAGGMQLNGMLYDASHLRSSSVPETALLSGT